MDYTVVMPNPKDLPHVKEVSGFSAGDIYDQAVAALTMPWSF